MGSRLVGFSTELLTEMLTVGNQSRSHVVTKGLPVGATFAGITTDTHAVMYPGLVGFIFEHESFRGRWYKHEMLTIELETLEELGNG